MSGGFWSGTDKGVRSGVEKQQPQWSTLKAIYNCRILTDVPGIQELAKYLTL